jgi:hypothetical protein
MATLESLNAELEQHKEVFNRLRKEGAQPEKLEETKKHLQELKKAIGALTQSDSGAKDAGKKERLLLKTPKVRAGHLCVRHSFAHLDGHLSRFDSGHRARATMALARCSAANTSSAQ